MSAALKGLKETGCPLKSFSGHPVTTRGGSFDPPVSAIAENRRSIQTCGLLRFRSIRVSGDPMNRKRMVIGGVISHHQSPFLNWGRLWRCWDPIGPGREAGDSNSRRSSLPCCCRVRIAPAQLQHRSCHPPTHPSGRLPSPSAIR